MRFLCDKNSFILRIHPIALEIFLVIYVTCCDQLRRVSKITPRYLKLSTISNSWLSYRISSLMCFILLLLPNSIILVLLTFKNNLFSFNHWQLILNCVCVTVWSSFSFLDLQNTAVSSAYKQSFVFSESFKCYISFMKRQKSNGPRIDPCGTPDLTGR